MKSRYFRTFLFTFVAFLSIGSFIYLNTEVLEKGFSKSAETPNIQTDSVATSEAEAKDEPGDAFHNDLNFIRSIIERGRQIFFQ